MKTDNIPRIERHKGPHMALPNHSGSEQRCQKSSAHMQEGTLELPSLERSEPAELIASSLMGGEEKQLSGYQEVAGSTSEGIELHRLIIFCANMLC